MWREREDYVIDSVLEGGRERWSRELSIGLAFEHAINLCLSIDFSRPSHGYDCYWSHLYCCGGFPKGVTMKGG